MRIVLRLIFIITMATVTGCGTVSFEDVSNITPYSESVGLALTSNEDVIFHGWTEEDHTVQAPVFFTSGSCQQICKVANEFPSGVKG
ncbi:hypothetical protein Marme_0404 [Marinomonas mediterranea MMB-1]|uniref:Lipoprotein n=1 Tax=Marinomonas mediterranea (strain ATCC 700492 / JCM 21426 / NBRC 103028 / MMB-1) TaxID=717774 RepID=F2JYS9_MARM1|nr:hypothetical protein Marme_0404 [Marinomonas mediterranea MMB-1]